LKIQNTGGVSRVLHKKIIGTFERDIFFNRLVEGVTRPEMGLQVSFNLTLNDKGQPQATNLKLSGVVKNKVLSSFSRVLYCSGRLNNGVV